MKHPIEKSSRGETGRNYNKIIISYRNYKKSAVTGGKVKWANKSIHETYLKK